MNHFGRQLTLTTLAGSLLAAGCNLSDAAPSLTSAGAPCPEEGERAGALTCRDGVWVEATAGPDMAPTTQDMRPEDMASMIEEPDAGPATDPDLAAPEDIPPGCEPTDPDQLCAQAGADCGLQVVADGCGEVIEIDCGGCDGGQMCDLEVGVCVCEPLPCPANVMCARVLDGCGSTRLCDQCPEGTACDEASLSCECASEETDAELCQGARACGIVELADRCGASRQIDCGGCPGPESCQRGTCQPAQLISRVVREEERFGASLSLDGDALLVGEPHESGSEEASAFVFRRQPDQSWALEQRFGSEEHVEYRRAQLGFAVALVGDRLALGRAGRDGFFGPPNGALLTWAYQGGQWQTDSRFDSGSNLAKAHNFGWALAATSSHVLVGAPGWSDDRGRAQLFTWTGPDNIVASFEPSMSLGSVGRAGEAVALSDQLAVIGAPARNGEQGGVEVFERQPNGSWSSLLTLLPPMPESGARFGAALALEGTTFAVGAPYQGVGMIEKAGAVFVYEYSPQGGAPTQTRIDPPAPVDPNGNFGHALELRGDHLVIGARDEDMSGAGGDRSGAVYVFERVARGDWQLLRRIEPPIQTEQMSFGWSVALDADTLAIGAPNTEVSGQKDAGAVFLYAAP